MKSCVIQGFLEVREEADLPQVFPRHRFMSFVKPFHQVLFLFTLYLQHGCLLSVCVCMCAKHFVSHCVTQIESD